MTLKNDWVDGPSDPVAATHMNAVANAVNGLVAAPTAVKTSAYTAAAGDLVPVDATSGAVAITVTSAPADGSRIAVKKIDSSTNAVTITTGGSDVFNKTGGGTTLTLSLQNQAAVLQYKASGAIWYVVSTDVPLGGLDSRYKPIESGVFPWPQGLVGLWDFQQDTAGGTTLTSRVGSQVSTLTALGSKTVVKDAADPGPFGDSLVLDGATAFVKSDNLGALDVSKTGDRVTVITWVKDTANNHDDTFSGIAFRAGSHCEPGDTPARQYASYFDANYASWSCSRYTPHIGAQDGPTPGYPYNVDFASTARKLFTGTGQSLWHMEAFTYDGLEIVAYVDGMTDSFKNAVEIPATPGSGYTLARVTDGNPHPVRKGINRSPTVKRFSIGGSSKITAGVVSAINYTTGKLGGVAVFNRALSADEIMQIRLATLLPSEAITMFGFEVSSTGFHALNEIGWSAGGGAANAHVGSLTPTGPEFAINRPAGGPKSYLTKSSTGVSAAWGPVSGLNSSQVARIRFKLLSAAATSAAVRPMVKVGSKWWASNTTFATTGAHASDTDWTAAELKTLAVDWGIGNWREVTIADTGATATVQNLAKRPTPLLSATDWFKASGSAPNATGARVSDGAGGFLFRYTWTGTDGGNVVIGGLNYTGIAAVTAGNLYSGSAVFSPSKAQKLNLQLVWVDSSNTQFATTDGGTIAVGANNPTTLTISATAPAGAVAVIVRVQSTGTAWFSGDTLDMNKVMVVNGLLPLSYFDGSTPGAAWDGTAGNSTSTYTNMPVGVLSLAGSTNTAYIDNALITAVGFLSSGGDGSAVRVTDLELLAS